MFHLQSRRISSVEDVRVQTSRKHPSNKGLFLWDPGNEKKNVYPFTINSHVNVGRNAQVCDLGDVFNMLHVRGITTSPEDDGYLSFRADVVRRDKCAGGIVYKCR